MYFPTFSLLSKLLTPENIEKIWQQNMNKEGSIRVRSLQRYRADFDAGAYDETNEEWALGTEGLMEVSKCG